MKVWEPQLQLKEGTATWNHSHNITQSSLSINSPLCLSKTHTRLKDETSEHAESPQESCHKGRSWDIVDATASSHPRVTAAALNPAQLFYQLPEAFGQTHPGWNQAPLQVRLGQGGSYPHLYEQQVKNPSEGLLVLWNICSVTPGSPVPTLKVLSMQQLQVTGSDWAPLCPQLAREGPGTSPAAPHCLLTGTCVS